MVRFLRKDLSPRSAGQRHEELFIFFVCAFTKLCRRIHVEVCLSIIVQAVLLTYFWGSINLSIVTRHSGLTIEWFVWLGDHCISSEVGTSFKVVWSRYEILHVARENKQVGS